MQAPLCSVVFANITHISDTTAALRITTPTVTDERTPTHFMALLDVSESMDDSNKLKHVKRCMSLLLKFLTPADELSLVAFGEESRIVLKRVAATNAAVPMMEQAIDSLVTSGCTNLSAGLGSIREILTEAGTTLKPGLLVLTDGHANRGVSSASDLQAIVKRLYELYPELSTSFIAYGTDHNADLLKALAEETNGKYSIVENLEDAALSMGDTLGSMISCVAQNVVVELPEGTEVEGPWRCSAGRLTIGDLYAGSQKLILLKKPAGAVRVHGVSLPLLEPFNIEAAVTEDRTRNAEIDLTRLRYRCAEFFEQLRVGGTLAASELASFRLDLGDSFLAGDVANMLLAELASIDAAVEQVGQHGSRLQPRLRAQLTQHAAFALTGSGTSQPIQRRVAFTEAHSDEEEPVAPAAVLSPTATTRQRHVSNLMRTMSQQPS